MNQKGQKTTLGLQTDLDQQVQTKVIFPIFFQKGIKSSFYFKKLDYFIYIYQEWGKKGA